MTKTSSPPDPIHTLADDLVALERRGSLSEPERRRLEVALNASSSLSQLRFLGRAFDAVPEALPGDDAILARISVRTAQRKPSVPQRGQRVLVAASVAAVALASLTAAAMVARGNWPRLRSPTRVETAAVPSASTPAHRAVRARPKTEPQEMPPEPEASGEPLLAPPRHKSTQTPVLDAAELFTRANRARRQGELSRALQLYDRLVREYPSSPQALVSHVVRARIELNTGNAGQALRQYNAYLGRAPEGALAQEALDGKARALSLLGRTSEERAVCKTLLSRYPKSIYAEHARARLAATK